MLTFAFIRLNACTLIFTWRNTNWLAIAGCFIDLVPIAALADFSGKIKEGEAWSEK